MMQHLLSWPVQHPLPPVSPGSQSSAVRSRAPEQELLSWKGLLCCRCSGSPFARGDQSHRKMLLRGETCAGHGRAQPPGQLPRLWDGLVYGGAKPMSQHGGWCRCVTGMLTALTQNQAHSRGWFPPGRTTSAVPSAR